MIKPIAVLTADVHYNLQTLPIATEAMECILSYAETHTLPVIVAGDLHDTKAALRGEVVHAMLNTFSNRIVPIYVTIGNHDRFNEKSSGHSLEFLVNSCNVISAPTFNEQLNLWLVPYFSDIVALKAFLVSVKYNSTLIVHQGVSGSAAGHYIKDNTALSKADFAPFRVISGHYHERQTIETSSGNKFDYIGNPYSLNFGEAGTALKGFQVLFDDGSLEFHALPLRKHVKLQLDVTDLAESCHKSMDENDLVWIQLSGTTGQLANISKDDVADYLGRQNFKFDKIPTDSLAVIQKTEDTTDAEFIDAYINKLPDPIPHKEHLKILWKDLVES